MDNLTLPIYGMNCAACATSLQQALNQIEGIKADVNFVLESALITFKASKDQQKTLSLILELLEKKGYQTDSESLTISVTGWHCSSCMNKTVKRLNELPFIIDIQANFATEKLLIRTIKGVLKKTDIGHFSELLPYQFSLENKLNIQDQQLLKTALQKKQNKKTEYKLIFSVLLSLPFLISMINMFISGEHNLLNPWFEFILATPVQFIIGARFYQGAYASLKNRSANMDLLVALGTSAAYFYSLYLLLAGLNHALYFESSVLVVTLVTLGKYLEDRAKQSTTTAINALMALRPNTAKVKKGKLYIDMEIDDVQIGDLVQVSIGEKVAVDGIVITGESYLDESLLTGESAPVLKTKKSNVVAGSLNGNSVLLIKTTAVGEQTSLNKIISLVENAQMSKAPILQLVDKISSVFVPIVLLIATFTFIAWYLLTADFQQALISSVAVLVIACPCALGLATPTAMVVGTGVAAQKGILIKDIKTLQQAYKLQTIIFDKTGTLTQGKGEVSTIFSVNNEPQKLLSQIYALQTGSKHPIANAVKNHCQKHNIDPLTAENIQAINGMGIKGIINKKSVLAGNLKLMRQFNISLPQTLSDKLEKKNESIVFIAFDHLFIGYICITDKLREESYEAIQGLQKQGLKIVILSGDKQNVVEHIAEQLQINDFYAQLLPEQKLEKLTQLQKNSYIAMVGDGVNDAPALAAADISIAMGLGSDVAKQTASMTLMRNDPRLVSVAIEVSNATWRTIKQNLFWAFVFNMVAIPAAAMGYLSPVIAGGAMALSSITVLTNSLLLKRFKGSIE